MAGIRADRFATAKRLPLREQRRFLTGLPPFTALCCWLTRERITCRETVVKSAPRRKLFTWANFVRRRSRYCFSLPQMWDNLDHLREDAK